MINFFNFQIQSVYYSNMPLKNWTFIGVAIVLGFIALSSLDSQTNENWIVHCFSCIG